jgi:putative ABC transport system permease protein
MFLVRFTLRRLLRHWPLNLAVLLGLSLAAALLAGLPGYAAATAGRSLEQALQAAEPATRNLQVTGPSSSLNSALYGFVQDELGDLVKMRLQVDNLVLTAKSGKAVVPVDAGQRSPFNYINVWSFDKMRHILNLVEGDWPAPIEARTFTEKLRPPILAAVIAGQSARQLGIHVGDQIEDSDGVVIHIVGMVEPINPEDDVWWGDTTAFEPLIKPTNMDDVVTLPLIVSQTEMKTDLGRNNTSWRVILDPQKITLNNALEVEQKLINIKNRIQTNRGKIATGLPDLLLKFRQDLATARMTFYLLSVQAFLFVLYTLAMIAALILEHSQTEMAILADRGANSLRITLTFAMENLPLGLLAGGILGPGLAYASLMIWSIISGETIPNSLPRESWLLSSLGAGFGWLAVVLPAYPVSGRNLMDWQRRIARPDQKAFWQKVYLDIFLLGLGGLLYWQLTTSGSFVVQRLREANVPDPGLMLGPVIFSIAIALVFLRLFPYLLRFVAWLVRSGRGLILPLGLSRLARSPVGPSRVVLLVSLAAGLTFFAQVFNESLTTAQDEMAHYSAGADLRLRLRDSSLQELTNLVGVKTVSVVYRGSMQQSDGRTLTLLAIQPDTFPQVTHYPPGMVNVNMHSIARVVKWTPNPSPKATLSELANPYTDTSLKHPPIAAIFSYLALPKGAQIGDTVTYTFYGFKIPFRVDAMLADFPTLMGRYVIADTQALKAFPGINASLLDRNLEAWANVDDTGYNAVNQNPILAAGILADARQERLGFEQNVLTLGAVRAFRLNALVLVTLSLAGFSLVNIFAANQRTYEFGVLRANGVSANQLLRLLVSEGLIVICLGLGIGTGVGYILTQVMRPYLSQAMATNLPGTAIHQVGFNLLAVGSLYAILFGSFTLAIGAMLPLLMRKGIHATLRVGEE